jgi:PST family polysaccharide transporter
MILGTLSLAPLLVPLIYSSQFTPAVEILEWQLIGDLFKFSSWTMGFVILARSSSVTVFIVELVVGVNLLATSWLGIHWFGLAGLGIGVLATYVVHYVITSLIVRRSIGLVWTLDNRLMLIGAVLVTALIRALSLTGLEYLRTPAALILAVLTGAGSLYAIWHQVAGTWHLPWAEKPGSTLLVEESPR